MFNENLTHNIIKDNHVNIMLPELPLLTISDRQDLYSMAYIRAIIAASGFNFSKSELDRNSDDLYIEFPNNVDISPTYGRLVVQVKCSFAHLVEEDGDIHFPLSIKNYNDLRGGLEPKILVVVLVPRPDGNPLIPWVECVDEHTIFRHRAYWRSLWGEPQTNNQANVTVFVPTANTFDIDSVRFLMDRMVVQGNKIP